MSGLVFLSLPLCMLIAGLLFVVAFLDAACSTPSFAGAVAIDRSKRPSKPQSASEKGRVPDSLVAEIAREQVSLFCPESQFVPQVTELEAKAIVHEILEKGVEEANRVLERSNAHDGICPMRLQNGCCACSVARPLECIGRCFAEADSREWLQGFGKAVSSAFHQQLESHHLNSKTSKLDHVLVKALAETKSVV